jgi:GNAT superfamily N-acetyltransferase
MEYKNNDYIISTDQNKLNIESIHQFLSTSYWAEDIPVEVVKKAIQHSLCFGIYNSSSQIGFARVITDYATFAYLADVYIIEKERGKGLSKWLMECILKHPDLQGLRNFCLMTRDAQVLYEKFGFKNIPDPKKFMAKKIDGIYKKRLA